jgi:dienelactone hydrolase
MMLGVMDADDGLEGEGGHADQKSQVQAVVSFFGPTELSADDVPTPTIPLLFDFIGGTKIKLPDQYKKASPITYVTDDDAPMLLLQGTKDPLVPHSQAFKMIDALTAAGVTGRAEILIGAGHGWGGEQLQQSLDETFEFLDEHLKP